MSVRSVGGEVGHDETTYRVAVLVFRMLFRMVIKLILVQNHLSGRIDVLDQLLCTTFNFQGFDLSLIINHHLVSV